MSSNAAQSLLRLRAKAAIVAGCLTLSPTLNAQDDSQATPPDNAAPDDVEPASEPVPREIIDLSVTVPKDPSDTLLEQDCEEENDAGRIANEIVVCRKIGEASDGVFDKADWEKRYAEKTKGGTTPDFIKDCHDQGYPFGCVRLGGVPPPILIIDVGALPEAPPGSDADRIARGLPPLGQDAELSEDEERARREALGTPASDIASAPE